MDPERIVRLAAGGISTIPPFTDKHPEVCLPHARQALISAGILKGIEKDARDKRRPLSQAPTCDQCGKKSWDMRSLHGPCGKCAFPNGVSASEERRRSKKAGLARRFRLDMALDKAERLGTATPKLRFDQSVAAMKVQRRGSRVVERAMSTGDLGHYARFTSSRGMVADDARRAAAFGTKIGALWTPRSSFPYRGDLKMIALNPETGMTIGSRATLLDEHYRRMSAEPDENLADAAVRGAAAGAGFGALVTGLRAAGAFRASGASLGQAISRAATPALIGGAIGGGLGIPFGVGRGYRRMHEIRKARQYTGSDPKTRRALLGAELGKALG